MCSWTPHTHYQQGAARGYNQAYLDKLAEAAEPLRSKDLPVIFTLKHLALLSGASWRFLEGVVSRKIVPYKYFTIHKRNGSPRVIAAPHPQLLLIQRFLHSEVLSRLQAHPASMAYASGCSPAKNASQHVDIKWLVKMDVTDFFRSIGERAVYQVFRNVGYRPLLAFQMARITTDVPRPEPDDDEDHENPRYSIYGYDVEGHLPQGAPTSPLLANLVSYELDDKLTNAARGYRGIYTRYADDLTFSFQEMSRNRCLNLIRDVNGLLAHHGLSVNSRKTRIVTPGSRKIVTGLIVNTDKPTIPRELKNKVRMHLYYCIKLGVSEHCQRRKFKSIAGFRARIQGLISYVSSVQPEVGREFREEMNCIRWPDLAEELYGGF